MKVIFVKDFSNKKAGTVVEMTSALYSELKRDKIVEIYDPNAMTAAVEIKQTKAPIKAAKPKSVKKAKKK